MNDTPEALSLIPAADYRNIPIEELVKLLKERESKRRDDEPDKREQAVSISYRFTIKGLEMASEYFHTKLGVGLKTFHRIQSHHVLAYFGGMPEIVEIRRLYDELLELTNTYNFPDIWAWAKPRAAQFSLVNETKVVCAGGVRSFSTIMWCRTELAYLADQLGIPSYQLFSIGAAWSFGTNQNGWSRDVIADDFEPEVRNLRRHLRERMEVLQFYKGIVNARIADAELQKGTP